ncbi:MAG: tectonin domain-containing protein [Candidatus Brocadiia bacterium]
MPLRIRDGVTENGRYSLRLQPLEPRLLLSAFGPGAGELAGGEQPLPAGVTEVGVFRGLDVMYPGDGVAAFCFGYEVEGSELTRLQATTPWGEVFDSDTILPGDWSGELFEYEDVDLNLEFEAEVDGGVAYFDLEWEYLTAAEWSDIGSNQSDLTVHYTGGDWSGSVGFLSCPLPGETPNITNPSHNAGSVPLTPTFQWDEWSSPGADGGIWWELTEHNGDDLYEMDEAPADTTSWTPGFSLDADTDYKFSLDFHNAVAADVNGVPTNIASGVELEVFFTTGTSGTAPELLVERGVDEGYPGDGLSNYEYGLEAEGEDLRGLSVLTPWGHVWDTGDYLPSGWSGAELDGYHSDLGLEWEAGSDGGMRYIMLSTSEVDADDWDLIDTGPASVELYYDGGVASGPVDFGSTAVPGQTPNITHPAHNATDVELTPTFEWDEWTSPGTGAGIAWILAEAGSDMELYDVVGEDPATTQWTPGFEMDPATEYEFELTFYHAEETTLGIADLIVASWREGEVAFTTSSAPGPRLLWGLNDAGGIFVRDGINDTNPTGVDWLRVPGRLMQVSVGEGNVWGLNANGGIFVREGLSESSITGTGWSRVTGSLAHVSVGEMGLVWGLNDSGGIFVRSGVTEASPAGTSWDRIPGKLVEVSVGEGMAWGLNANGGIFIREGVTPASPAGTNWLRLGGRLEHVAVGEQGLVWGLNPAGGIFVRVGVTPVTPAGTGWHRVPGRLAHVSAGFGSVWAVNTNCGIFWRDGVTEANPAGTAWSRCTGSLREVSVGLCTVRTTQTSKERAEPLFDYDAPGLHPDSSAEAAEWPEWLNWTEGALV